MSHPPDNDLPRLSIAMVVRDAAEILDDTLAGLDQVADEIVVLDTGSTDDSRRIAQRHGAKVVECPWSDDFAAARNAAIKATRGSWVLSLDAGEQLAEGTTEGIRSFVDAHPQPKSAHMVMVEIPAPTPGATGEQVAQIRLMPRLDVPVFSGRVRETPRPALLAAGVEIELSPWRIMRHAREHDPQFKADRARRDLELARLSIEESGLEPGMLIVRGEAYLALGNRQQAAAAFYQALRLAERGSIDMLEAYYGLLTTFVGDASDREHQLAICLEALEVFPLDAQLLCAMGNCLQARDRLDLAGRAFQAAAEHGAVEIEVWHLRDIRATATACLSLICELQGDQPKAEAVLNSALARLDDAPALRRHLIHLYVKRGRQDDALEQLELLPPDTPHREALRSAVRGACLAAQMNWPPALAYLETAHTAGCRDPLCLKWLFVALISTGRTEEAEEMLAEWAEVDPSHPEIAQYQAALCDDAQSGDADTLDADEQPAPVAAETNLHSDAARLRIDPSTTGASSAPKRPGAPASSLPSAISRPPASV